MTNTLSMFDPFEAKKNRQATMITAGFAAGLILLMFLLKWQLPILPLPDKDEGILVELNLPEDPPTRHLGGGGGGGNPVNSARREIYMPYYRPNNYDFNDIIESLKIVRGYGGWTSINYFVFPGMTDSVAEYEALRKLIKETDLCMIQWRNFNIDPDWYLGKIGVTDTGECMGVKQLMDAIQEEFPLLKFGYFNPSMERIKGNYEMDFAH